MSELQYKLDALTSEQRDYEKTCVRLNAENARLRGESERLEKKIGVWKGVADEDGKVLAEQLARIAALTADLARVTLERDDAVADMRAAIEALWLFQADSAAELARETQDAAAECGRLREQVAMLSPHDECDYCDMCSLAQNEAKWHALLAAAKAVAAGPWPGRLEATHMQTCKCEDCTAMRDLRTACAPPASGEE
jgi:hypothetical protein